MMAKLNQSYQGGEKCSVNVCSPPVDFKSFLFLCCLHRRHHLSKNTKQTGAHLSPSLVGVTVHPLLKRLDDGFSPYHRPAPEVGCETSA